MDDAHARDTVFGRNSEDSSERLRENFLSNVLANVLADEPLRSFGKGHLIRETLGTQTKVRSERRAILVDWIQGIRWAGDEAEITLRLPVKPVANCQHDQPDAGPRIGAGRPKWRCASRLRLIL